MSKASHYLERFMSKELMDARAVVDDYCDKDAMVEELKNNKDDLKQVRLFANFFQELGIAYKKGLVDQNYTEDIFDFLTKSYWDKLIPWIYSYRKIKGDPSLYSKWGDLAVAFKHKANIKSGK